MKANLQSGPAQFKDPRGNAEAGVQIRWPAAPAGWALGEREVHVWAEPLRHSAGSISDFAAILSPDELERAASYRFDLHRNRFVAGRRLLRTILGRYLNLRPGEIAFAHGHHGKPRLACHSDEGPLSFNVAHSGDLLVLAVTRFGDVGIDVEQVTDCDGLEFEAIAAAHFAPREKAALRNLGGQERLRAFFNLWTRKEAYLKATGEGIGEFLSEVEVSFIPGDVPKLIATPVETEDAGQWTLCDLGGLAAGYAGALAVKNRDVTVHCWRWGRPEILSAGDVDSQLAPGTEAVLAPARKAGPECVALAK